MKIVRLLAALVFTLMTACGGGGGGGSSATPTRTGTQPTKTPTPTKDPSISVTPTPKVIVVGSALFVRAQAGNDSNNGRSPDTAFQTIGAAIAALPGLSSGRTIVVGPGTYVERIEEIPNGTEERPVILFADPTGDTTQERSGAVILRNTGAGSMIRLSNREFVEIDGS